MKSIQSTIASVAALTLALAAHGQSNTFPSSGDVGIGTTSPAYPLHISTATNIAEYLYSTNGQQTGIYLQNSNTGNWWGVGAWANGNFTIDQYGVGNRFVINGSGYVGIGTISPATTLDIAGGADVQGGFTVGYNQNIGVNNGLILGTVEKANSPSGGQGAIQIISNDSSNQLQGLLSLVTDPTGTNRRLSIQAIEQGIAFRNVTLAENGGNVGIGTSNPTQMLSVAGTVQAYAVTVQNNWSDYVFEPDYKLPSLASVEKTIQTEHHLPGIPSAEEVAAKGINVGDMEAKLLAQIEELTLRQIEQEKLFEKQSKLIRAQAKRLEEQERELKTQAAQIASLSNRNLP